MKNPLQEIRLSIALLAVSGLIMLLAAYYFQYILNMEPCPLCLMQRLCIVLFIIAAAVAVWVQSPKARQNALSVAIFTVLAGLFFAGRQIWLQSLTDTEVPACMPGLDVLIKYFPWKDVAHALFWGAGDCAEVDWQFLGLSMAAWVGIYFVSIALVLVILKLRLRYTLR